MRFELNEMRFTGGTEVLWKGEGGGFNWQVYFRHRDFLSSNPSDSSFLKIPRFYHRQTASNGKRPVHSDRKRIPGENDNSSLQSKDFKQPFVLTYLIFKLIKFASNN